MTETLLTSAAKAEGTSTRTPVLNVASLISGYGPIEVLHGVDIQLFPGELVALVGANGAGKTTLLRTITGLIPQRAGRVELFGRDVSKTRPDLRVASGLAQVLEGRQVFGPLSVVDNLRLGGFCNPGDFEEKLKWVYELFPILSDRREQSAGTLSGGQQQMLAIGRALMSSPKVLLLDEPSMGLAPLLVKEIFAIITKLKSQGIPILLVEQNALAALSIADRGYVLETGKVSVEGAAKDLLSDEKVKTAYLGL